MDNGFYENADLGQQNQTPCGFAPFQAVFAVVFLILGLAFIKFIILGGLGVAATIFVVLFVVSCIAYFKVAEKQITRRQYLAAICIILFSSCFTLYGMTFTNFLALIFIALCSMYLVYTMSGSRSRKSLDAMLIAQLFKIFIPIPFSNFGAAGGAISSLIKGRTRGKKIAGVLLGLLIALPVTALAAGLLSSADQAFSIAVSKLLHFFGPNIKMLFVQCVFAVPIGFYLFGALYGSENNSCSELLSDEKCNVLSQKARIFPSYVFCAAALPLSILYLIFFVSQSLYFFGAFHNLLPQGYSYADYARRGFFELCAVALINGGIILIAELFVKRNNGKRAKTVVGAQLFITLSSFVFIAIGMTKMFMYVQQYGLTPLRVYTSWFMILLAAFFIIAVVHILRQCGFIKPAVTIFAVMFTILVFCNTDGLIARYDIWRYNSGSLRSLSMTSFAGLSAASVEPIVKDMDYSVMTKDNKRYISRILADKKVVIDKQVGWKSFSVTRYQAVKALQGYDFSTLKIEIPSKVLQDYINKNKIKS